ncbi:MAG: glutamine synthetase [Parachlamydiaceae bacterium]|nr:glutamine synthetase [Parachlamydiaceae bacterium]
MDATPQLRNFLELPYTKLEELNLTARKKRNTLEPKELEELYRKLLEDERQIKAVTVFFSDIEGRFHALDYDKKYLLDSADNLTFDGSSIKGFTSQNESDLRFNIDWTSFIWLPSDIFGAGKVGMFANIMSRDKEQYTSDSRGLLQQYSRELRSKHKLTANIAPEIEGFLLKGEHSEQNFNENEGFSLISNGGYFHSLSADHLRKFIDATAEALNAMGYINEKDHPEVAPSQFELNFTYDEALRAADKIQLYKLAAKQIAFRMGMTACFLPKPIVGINGSGMHINFSLSQDGKNIFYDKKGQDGVSKLAWDGISRLLNHAGDICLVLNSSVNSYRRLDPHFEAPNQIKVSAYDRGSMIRIPTGNERSARIEIRAVAPDANPYLAILSIIRTALEGDKSPTKKQSESKFLPSHINQAIELFNNSSFMTKILGDPIKEKYAEYKQATADRCPKQLGKRLKNPEILFHHEITNQVLWNNF